MAVVIELGRYYYARAEIAKVADAAVLICSRDNRSTCWYTSVADGFLLS
jgi:Flp pilus assembly protein TadG